MRLKFWTGMAMLVVAAVVVRWSYYDHSPLWTPDGLTREQLSELHSIRTGLQRLKPLHLPKRPPEPSDWLAQNAESGQSFEEYLVQYPQRFREKYRAMHIQPLGEFSESQQRLVLQTAEFMRLCFELPVDIRESIPLDSVPSDAQRQREPGADRQVLNSYLLDQVLAPLVPPDSAAFLGLTKEDLFAGPDSGYRFGAATLGYRCGVWSLYRFGDPDRSPADYQLCLRRTIGTALHENGAHARHSPLRRL